MEILSEKADKVMDIAIGLNKAIDAKHASANGQLAKNPTRKRLQEAEQARMDARRLERLQACAVAIAHQICEGTVNPALEYITSRAALERALRFTKGWADTPREKAVGEAFKVIWDQTEADETDDQKAVRLEREARLQGIPGFFPTPPEVARMMCEMAGLKDTPGVQVLEPSAGAGGIADVARDQYGASVWCCEVNPSLRAILELKKFKIIGKPEHDFLLAFYPNEFWPVILMNPPFEHGQDIDHVRHAYSMLGPGGQVVAIMSEGVFFRTDAKSIMFRSWLDDRGGTSLQLAPKAFAGSGTNVACRIVHIQRAR